MIYLRTVTKYLCIFERLLYRGYYVTNYLAVFWQNSWKIWTLVSKSLHKLLYGLFLINYILTLVMLTDSSGFLKKFSPFLTEYTSERWFGFMKQFFFKFQKLATI